MGEMGMRNSRKRNKKKWYQRNQWFKSIFSFILGGIFVFCTLCYEEVIPFINSYIQKFIQDEARKTDIIISYIDVGQADATLVQNNGYNLLIDTGNREDGETIETYLKQCGVSKLDGVILTHWHEDHIGGFSYIAQKYEIEQVYIRKNVNKVGTKVYEDTREAIKEKKIKTIVPSHGETVNFGQAEIKFVGPVNPNHYEDENANSLCMILSYGKTKFYFGGDSTKEAETDILESGYDLEEIDVYKVSHHGSSYSSSYRFIREISGGDKRTKPFYAIVSCGKNNDYGHPHKETIDRLQQADAMVYRTDLLGTIMCYSNGLDIKFAHNKKE